MYSYREIGERLVGICTSWSDLRCLGFQMDFVKVLTRKDKKSCSIFLSFLVLAPFRTQNLSDSYKKHQNRKHAHRALKYWSGFYRIPLELGDIPFSDAHPDVQMHILHIWMCRCTSRCADAHPDVQIRILNRKVQYTVHKAFRARGKSLCCCGKYYIITQPLRGIVGMC